MKIGDVVRHKKSREDFEIVYLGPTIAKLVLVEDVGKVVVVRTEELSQLFEVRKVDANATVLSLRYLTRLMERMAENVADLRREVSDIHHEMEEHPKHHLV